MTATTQVKSYSLLLDPVAGNTGTGLDQLVARINSDLGLAGANTGPDIAGGAAAANGLNHLIIEAALAVNAIGSGDRGFSVADVEAINAWIRDPAHPERYESFVALHGDDEDGSETGFHLVQNDGATGKYRGQNAIDTVVDGIYHIGFAIENGRFLNEDGDANASVEQVAAWLTQFYTDHSTTGTGLDRIPDLIMADSGLARKIPEADIQGGADAANGIDGLIADAIAATGATADNWISSSDIVAINTWIRADAGRYGLFLALHGDDENGSETGFHLVQNDGASTRMFGQNFVNTVADGIYHIGFEIEDGRLENEDGDANATVGDVADWINYFYTDQSTTGTGLDRIVDAIKLDTGLSRDTRAGDINGGADAANDLNALIVAAIDATKAMSDGWLTGEDMVAINAWIQTYHYDMFVSLHGDDENGSETGFHLVQNDGATSQLFGQNLVNTVADGIYHIGFDIEEGRFVNEDGDANATIEDVATWLNYFYGEKTIVLGTEGGNALAGSDLDEEVDARGGDDAISAGGGNDLVLAGWGCDTVDAGAGADIVYGGLGDDKLNGGADGDLFRVLGNQAGGWSSFQGFDTYNDTGVSGVDAIVAIGTNVDIGLTGFSQTNGIDVIDGVGASGQVRLLGDWKGNTLDFRAATFTGKNIVIDGGDGNDTIFGTKAGSTIIGGRGDDKLNGEAGNDKYIVTGNYDAGWESFQGFDTYADSAGTDTICAIGTNVDIGLTGFSQTNGIDVIDGVGASGQVRLLGDWKGNTLDFRAATFTGKNIVIDGGDGNDTIFGTKAGSTIIGGRGDDKLNGEAGNDKYIVTGNYDAGWESFQGFDTYADSAGTDTICAIGTNVDIGLTGFSQTNGIDVIDGTGASGQVRLLGDWKGNTLDFRAATFTGKNIVIDGGDGNDTIFGTKAGSTIIGGRGDDKLNGEAGNDKYIVTGNYDAGWESFQGFDTYADSAGTDTICAIGTNVDIGLTGFSQTNGIDVIDGAGASGQVRLLGDWKGNTLDFRAAAFTGKNIVIDGGDGNDTIFGTKAGSTIIGGRGDDKLNGEAGNDKYIVTGNYDAGWESFQGFDTYADSAGTDTICAIGTNVDIGLTGFSQTNGIDVIDGAGASGQVRLLGDWKGNTLDFRAAAFTGKNIVIDGGDGNDTIFGTKAGSTIIGGRGDDKLNGEAGNDKYIVTGNYDAGWESFQGFDTYADSAGTDTICAIGTNVDIGLTGFSQTNGIDVIDGTGASGQVRLLGDWKGNTLDFRAATFTGKNIVIDGGDGNDTIFGTKAGSTIIGGRGDDKLNGEAGNDKYIVTGNYDAGWESFQGFDTYADSAGTDTICAIGTNVDIGLTGFSQTNGIDVIDGVGASGQVRLLGDWKGNTLDFRAATFTGKNIVIDGGDGNDTIFGTKAGSTIIGGRGDDKLNGEAGNDKYIVTGNYDAGWESFQGFDTYADSAGTDTICAIGTNVDIGLTGFSQTNGIDVIDGTGASGQVRLLGDWKGNTLDFRAATFTGKNIVIDGGDGNDTIFGTAGAEVIAGGWGNDTLSGGGSADAFRFEQDLNAWGNVDTVTDFQSGVDVFELSAAVFDALAGMSVLGADLFVIGKAAADANDRIIYDDAAGRLYYDEDGVGGSGQILFAKVAAKSTVVAGDFHILAGDLIA